MHRISQDKNIVSHVPVLRHDTSSLEHHQTTNKITTPDKLAPMFAEADRSEAIDNISIPEFILNEKVMSRITQIVVRDMKQILQTEIERGG